jgi:hypothetical protein
MYSSPRHRERWKERKETGSAVARPSHIEWPKRVLRQTILVSGIAAEIESSIDRADWDADCYEGCRRLLLRETKRMGTISEEQGPEEVPVLADFEVQHWVAEALESATRATGLILGWVASMVAHDPNQDQKEAGALDPAASRATKAVMRAATANPLSDAQLERIVKLALGKRVPVAPTATAGGGPPQATSSTARLASDHQAELEVASEDEGESHAADCTGPEGPPPARGEVQPASPKLQETGALSPSRAPTAQPPGGVPSGKAMVAIPGGKKKSRAAEKAAKAALEAESRSPTTVGSQAPPVRRPQQCPVFGCTREHVPSDCPTFLDMTPKERLDLVHAKQLCLLCLQHPLNVGCEVADKGSRCPAEGCDRPHHVTLHGILKAGKSSPPEGSTDPPDEPAVTAACRTPEMARQLRGLLEGLGIDPGALEVRIGIRKSGEPRRPCGGETTDPGTAGARVGRLTSELLGALTSLCQAGERFVDSAAESGQRMIGTADPTAIPRGSAHRSSGGTTWTASLRASSVGMDGRREVTP